MDFVLYFNVKVPATGCSPGNGFAFGLYGIICDVSGLGKACSSSQFMIACKALLCFAAPVMEITSVYLIKVKKMS